MKIVLILGGAGFIGKNLTILLLSKGIKVRILDTLAPQIHGDAPQNIDWLDHPLVEFFRGSILNRELLKVCLQDVSHIVHLAAETGTGQSMYEIARYNEINSQGTAILMDLLINEKDLTIQQVVLASSRSVYGEGAYTFADCDDKFTRVIPKGRSIERLESQLWDPICPISKKALTPIPTREDDPVNPASIYAATKLAQEELVKISCSAKDIGYSILRFQNVYGEGQSLENPYTGILSIFSTRIRRGMDLPIFEDGNETRDFVHVDDIANAVFACLNSNNKLDTVINVGSGKGTSILAVAEMMVDIFDRQVALRITSEFRLGDIRHNIADISKLRNLLSCNPTVDLASGLKGFIDWVKTQPLPEDRSELANKQLLSRNLMQ